MPSRKFWSEERNKALANLYFVDQKSAAICAEIFGVTRNSVLGAVHRLRQKLGISLMRKPGQAPRESKAKPSRPKAPPPKPRSLPRPSPYTPVVDPTEPLIESVVELNPFVCRYPYGTDNFKFCGRPRTYGAYCQHHGQLCYQPLLTRRAG